MCDNAIRAREYVIPKRDLITNVDWRAVLSKLNDARLPHSPSTVIRVEVQKREEPEDGRAARV